MKTYEILNNEMSFKIKILNNNQSQRVQVEIFKKMINRNYQIYYENFLNFDCSKAFIGKSLPCRMTLFSEGYGPKWDGNSILLHLNNNIYIFIGNKIFSFSSLSEIIEYYSPIGNNCIPYPYALDNDGNYYLLIEDVILLNCHGKLDYNEDPYDYYYDKRIIGTKRNFKNIATFLFGGEERDITFDVDPEKEYDRLLTHQWIGKDTIGQISLKMVNGDICKISKIEYISLMNEFGKLMQFQPLKILEKYY